MKNKYGSASIASTNKDAMALILALFPYMAVLFDIGP